jgi:peptidyl-prolyl cis-trans isomerase A (cyclophilin A)
VCLGDQPELDAGGARQPDGLGFAAFASVREGMAIVREIARHRTRRSPERGSLEGQILERPVPIDSLAISKSAAPERATHPGNRKNR